MKGILKIGAGAALVAALLAGGTYFTSRTEVFMAETGNLAGNLATSALGTEVEVGSVEVSSLHDLTIRDIRIYDKQAELIARADSARVSFRLLAAVSDPADAVQEITVRGGSAVLAQRTDGTWNVEDLVGQEKSSQQFHYSSKISI